GSMSVVEYEERFVELERFAPHVCATERSRVVRFVGGLKSYIRGRVIAQDHQTLASAVRAACLVEGERELFLEERNVVPVSVVRPDRRRKRCSFSSVKHKWRHGSSSSSSPLAAESPALRQMTIPPAVPLAAQRSRRSFRPFCPQCERCHGGTECWKASGKCF